MTHREILEHHRKSLKGRLRGCLFSSKTLGIKKPYYVYEPAGLNDFKALPTLYLFRGHEREWVNMNEDSSRVRSTAIDDLDSAINAGLIPPVLAVMPGLNSSNNYVPSLGINMVGKIPLMVRGLGTGRFWDYLTEEFMPAIRKRYPQANGRQLASGFSLGGYTASLLGICKPGLFDDIGIYDGLFMWPAHQDPREQPLRPGNDKVWLQNGLFDAAFGKPRNMQMLEQWNPTDALKRADEAHLSVLRKTTWWISCAAQDGQQGNKDRAEYYRRLLPDFNIPLGEHKDFEQVVYAPEASHNWHWTDKFLISFLRAALM